MSFLNLLINIFPKFYLGFYSIFLNRKVKLQSSWEAQRLTGLEVLTLIICSSLTVRDVILSVLDPSKCPSFSLRHMSGSVKFGVWGKDSRVRPPFNTSQPPPCQEKKMTVDSTSSAAELFVLHRSPLAHSYPPKHDFIINMTAWEGVCLTSAVLFMGPTSGVSHQQPCDLRPIGPCFPIMTGC